MENKGSRKWIAGVVVLAVAVLVLVVAYGVFREKPVEGSKSIVIEVVDQDEDRKSVV